MNQKFQAAVHQRDELTYVKLAGVIDEDNELGDLTEKIPAGTVLIDLSEIERINACGVRDWVNWLGRLEKQGGKAVLVECSPAIVAQINLVNNFTGAGVVKSFFAPYFCPNCDREKVLLVEASELGPPPHKAPTCRCDECDGVMDFDDMEDSYFAFLSNARKVADAAKIQKVMSEMNPGGGADGDKSKIRSRVGNTSQPGSSAAGSSLPSVPSLPSISRTGTGVGSSGGASFGGGTGTGNRGGSGVPAFGKGSASSSGLPGTNPGPGTSPGSAPQMMMAGPKSSMMVYVLVGVLLLAIGVLAVLLFSGSGRGNKKSSADSPPVSATR
jgi:anti-anti-sigma regulatory factor